MQKSDLGLDDMLYEYLLKVSLREADVLRRLREETAAMPLSIMQIAPEQGQFMALLVELMGATRCIEVGVFTGYSSLAVALALPPKGRITACDISEEFTAVARRYWAEAGVVDRIELRLGAATESLASLLAEGRAASFDFVYIDANKKDYDAYYEAALGLTRPGGLIAIDNVFWHGRVLDAGDDAKSTRAIRALNKNIHADERVGLSVIPIGDGLTLVCKRG